MKGAMPWLVCLLLMLAAFTGVGAQAEQTAAPGPGSMQLSTPRVTAAPMPGAIRPAVRTPEPMPTLEPVETISPLRLSGVKVGIDPGHQGRANSDKEAVAPGSSEMKAKVSSGTAGVRTRVDEHVVNLDVSLQLRDALESLGAEVYLTRDTADVDISNQERAIMMNDLGVDIVLRIHCNGADSSSKNGIGMYIRKTGTNAEACELAAQALLAAMVETTGARADGIFKSDTYTGLNWSTVPSVLVEMGYMSNPDEDVRLNDPDYQAKLVSGMVEGIAAFMGR